MSESELRRELDRTKRFLQLVLETGEMNASLVDTDLRHTWVHNSAPEPEESEIIGKTDEDLFPSDVAKPTTEIKLAAIETESRVEREFTFLKPQGQNRYRAAAEPLRDDDDGDVTGAAFAAVDLSDRYGLLDRTSDAVYTVDADWVVTFWNERMAARTGVEPEAIVGKTLWEVFGADIPDALEARYREVMETGEPAEFEQYVPDPFDYWVEIRAFADDDGLSVYSRDVTERKAYEQRLREQRDALDVLNQVLRHDIRNDLQLVVAYADLISEDVDEEHQANIQRVLDSARHAVDLTTSAREISDAVLSADEATQRVDLEATLDREIADARAAYPHASITVEDSLPAVTVLADDMLDSVFRNLIKNAIQHSDRDEPAVDIGVEVAADEVIIRVSDDGPGIPEDRTETVFEQGERGLDSEGTGIGLTLVETLVENYGGRVWVEDGDPIGAMFGVELPRVRTD